MTPIPAAHSLTHTLDAIEKTLRSGVKPKPSEVEFIRGRIGGLRTLVDLWADHGETIARVVEAAEKAKAIYYAKETIR